jgi:flagella basal body P-ring formation protein FlgA
MISRILLVTFCSIGFAAECVPVAGGRILARDLARAMPAFAGLPPEMALGYAPAPGSRRVYSAAELRRLAESHGLTVDPGVDACLVRPAGTLTRELVTAAMQLTVPKAHNEVLELSRQPVPPGELRFPISGLSVAPASEPDSPRVWRGQVRQLGQDDFPVWAKVRILVSGTRAVASEALLPGRRIERSQIRLEAYEGAPGMSDPAQIVGRAPRRPISAGTAIEGGLLEEPQEVLRGERVRVEVWSGQARLLLEGEAQSSGRHGETIGVRNPATGKVFSAKVQNRGQVSVVAGWSAPGGSNQ